MKRIDVESSDDILIIRLRDRKILDAANIESTGSEMMSVVAGVEKPIVILDLQNVAYMSSAMLGKLFMLNRSVDKAKGRLVFVGLNQPMMDLMEVTKATKMFDFWDDVDSAIDSIRNLQTNGLQIALECPDASCGTTADHRFVAMNPRKWETSVTCRQCNATIELKFDGRLVRIAEWSMPTYEGESVTIGTIQTGTPALRGCAQIKLTGRLDLFAADTIQRAFESLPEPRYVVLDLSGMTEITDAGADGVAALNAANNDNRVVLYVDEAGQSVAEAIGQTFQAARTLDEIHERMGTVPANAKTSFTIPFNAN